MSLPPLPRQECDAARRLAVLTRMLRSDLAAANQDGSPARAIVFFNTWVGWLGCGGRDIFYWPILTLF
jgi:hypothetical protein